MRSSDEVHFVRCYSTADGDRLSPESARLPLSAYRLLSVKHVTCVYPGG